MSEGKEVAKLDMDEGGIVLKSIDEAYRFGQFVVKSELAPKSFNTAAKVIMAVQTGAELGLTKMASLQNMVVINGKITLMGDIALALVLGSGKADYVRTAYTGDGDGVTCTVTAKRLDEDEQHEFTFSAKDAKTAGLWDKTGPWKQYPKRMLYYRALGFALRDTFADCLKGVHLTEEFTPAPPEQRGPPKKSDHWAAVIEGEVPPTAGAIDGGGGNAPEIPESSDGNSQATVDSPETSAPGDEGSGSVTPKPDDWPEESKYVDLVTAVTDAVPGSTRSLALQAIYELDGLGSSITEKLVVEGVKGLMAD